MGRDLLAFSECGKHFVYCGQDGKLKLWDAVTGTLKQEYVPNVHLNSPCTSLVWITLSKSKVPWENRKRKLEGKVKKYLALGTFKGSIALYSLSEGKVILNLESTHSSSVSCVSWSKDAGLFSVGNSEVFHWDLASKSVKNKWKCGKKSDNISQLAVSDDGELCATASYNLQLWQVKTHTLLKTFIGHSSQAMSLAFVASNYLLSSAENDREISAWNLTADSEHPVARFALTDSLNCQMSVTESNGSIHLAGVTKSGVLHIYHQQLNGQCKKAVKPSTTVEIAADKTGSSVLPIPVLGACFNSSTLVSIAYGHLPKFSFESVDVSEGCDKSICLVRSENRAPIVNNMKVEETISEDVEYVNGGVKRKLDDDPLDVPMEERLGNLCIDPANGGTTKASPHNMAQLLVQGLESKDKSLLESVLFRRDPQVINETVSRLPLRALGPLIKELTNLLQGKTLVSMLATSWLKCVLATHAGQLLSDSRTHSSLTGLHSLVESRLMVLSPLTNLSGRLDLLLDQLEPTAAKQSALGLDALVVYQDEDSSDDGGSSMLGEGDVGGNESEDKWEELSEQEINSEDANLSS